MSTQIAFTAAEIGVLSTFNGDSMPDNVRAKMDELTRITGVLVEAKNVANNASTEKGNAWAAIRDVALAVAEATAATPKIRELVFNSVMHDYVTADKASAKASLKSYVSTGRTAILKLLDVTHTAEQLAQLSYKEVRDALSVRADAVFFDKVKKTAENLRYVEKQIKTVKKAEDADQQMALLHNLLDGMLAESQQMRDIFKSEKADNSQSAKLAKEIHADRQQAPTEPTVIETSKAA